MSSNAEKEYNTRVEPFGDGSKITLSSPDLRVSLLTNGATLSSVQYRVPRLAGQAGADSEGWVELTLGYDLPEEFAKDTAHMGRTVGRYAGRIANGEMQLGGKDYKLPQNNGGHTLHGGPKGFSMIPWKYTLVEGEEEMGVSFHLSSPHLDQGFPGEVLVTASYAILKNRPATLKWNFQAVLADGTPVDSTTVNLCNHAYWNLNGVPRRDGVRALPEIITNHHLQLSSKNFAETNDELIPNGSMKAVAGTPHDYSTSRALLEGMEATQKEGRDPPGYDDPIALDRWDSNLREAAVLHSPKTNITMRMETTSPAVIIYTTNHMPVEATGMAGERFQRHSAICLETQYFPNSPNIPAFPSTELKKGGKYNETTVCQFQS